MPRTVPDIGLGTPTYVQVSFRMVDNNGDTRSFALRVPAAMTFAQLEAVTAALAAASNANVYEVHKDVVFAAPLDPSDATSAVHESANDAVVLLEKVIATGETQNAYIPAPIESMFETESNTLKSPNTELDNFVTAVDAILAGDWTPISVRYSERRKTHSRRLY